MQNVIHHPAAYEAATKRRIIQNASITFFKTVVDAQALVAFMFDSEYRGDQFMASLAAAYANYGKLTEKQCQAIRNSMVRQAEYKIARDAAILKKNEGLSYIASVGDKKVAIKLTVKKIVQIQGASFSYYDSGVSNLYICEDAAGNKITYIGNSEMPKEGETADILCTIKAHKIYNNAKQTVINRPKLVSAP